MMLVKPALHVPMRQCMGGGIAMPALTALAVVKGEERQAQGSVMAILTSAHSLGMFTGSVMAGLAMDFFTLSYAFPCGSLVMAVGVLLFPVLYRRKYNHGRHRRTRT